jgi:hypothetical protein
MEEENPNSGKSFRVEKEKEREKKNDMAKRRSKRKRKEGRKKGKIKLPRVFFWSGPRQSRATQAK